MRSTTGKRTSRRRWCLYVVECADGTWYTGVTNDLPRRLAQHNLGTASRYTRSRLPVRLVYTEPCRDRSSALRKELQMKSLSRRDKQSRVEKGLRRRPTDGSPRGR